MNNLLTVYKHDYIPLNKGSQFKAKDPPGITDTVYETITFVTASENMREKDHPSSIDLANDYLNNTFKNKQPKLYNKYFKEPISKSVALGLNQNSTYTNDYCKFPKITKQKIIFDTAGLITTNRETTMQNSYRNPDELGEHPRTLPAKPATHALKQTHIAVTSILKDEPITEYQRLIGTTGKRIIDHQMFGKMTYPEIPLLI